MIPCDVWKVGKIGPVNILIEVREHASYGYLWSKETGIVSHVWLYNGQKSEHGHEEPPAIEGDNIALDAYDVPKQIDDIVVEVDSEALECRFLWGGTLRAGMTLGKDVGWSTMVNSSSDAAIQYD